MKATSRSTIDFQLITVAQDAGTANLTLNRLNELNDVSMQMAKEAIQARDESEKDPTVSLVVPNGAGRAFLCFGRVGEASASAFGDDIRLVGWRRCVEQDGASSRKPLKCP